MKPTQAGLATMASPIA
jgi:hypothetical protein